MEKKELSKFLRKPRVKLDLFEEKNNICQKCDKIKKMDEFRYKNNLKIHLLNKNLSDNQLLKKGLDDKDINNSKKILKRALSGYTTKISRPTTSSTNNIKKSNKALIYHRILIQAKKSLNPLSTTPKKIS